MRPTRLLPPLAAAVATLAALTGTATAAVTHTVRRGETLTSVAAADGLSVAALAAANGLSPDAQLVIGRALVIPPRGAAPASTASPAASSAPSAATQAAPAAPAASAAGGYLVRFGDTLSAIAARLGTTPAALAAANGLSVDGVLLAGTRLRVDGSTSGEAPAPSATTAASTADPAGGAQPTDEFVAPSSVGEIAAADGVPAAFAEAIADQESGFDNAEVSGTGATGVMQIEPGSWRELAIDGVRLSPDSALDNVRGGVAILRSLLAATGGDEAQAAAAYFQGLTSLQRHGMYPSTRQYVRDVLALEGRFGG